MNSYFSMSLSDAFVYTVEAKPNHVAKFSAGYRNLFPAANQLILTCSAWDCFIRGVDDAVCDFGIP